MAQIATALRFIEAFPEAQAFNVCLLTEEKRAIVTRAQWLANLYISFLY